MHIFEDVQEIELVNDHMGEVYHSKRTKQEVQSYGLSTAPNKTRWGAIGVAERFGVPMFRHPARTAVSKIRRLATKHPKHPALSSMARNVTVKCDDKGSMATLTIRSSKLM